MSEERHACLNCRRVLAPEERYCSHCGQSTRDLRVSVWSLTGDFLSEIFSWDSKLTRSLKPLILKPGLLTKAFIEGQRVRFLPPVRMYLVFSVVFFLSLTLDKPDFRDGSIQIETDTEDLKRLRQDLETMEANGDTQDLDRVMARVDNLIEADTATDDKQDDTEHLNAFERFVQTRFVDKAERIDEMDDSQVLNMLFPRLMNYLSWSLFAMMPVFALIMKLLYIRRDPVYLDHLIFAFHYHSFLFLFLVIVKLWSMAVPVDTDGQQIFLVSIVPLLYLYKAMRRVYGQGRLKTGLKMWMLLSSYFVILMLAITVAALLTFAMADL